MTAQDTEAAVKIRAMLTKTPTKGSATVGYMTLSAKG